MNHTTDAVIKGYRDQRDLAIQQRDDLLAALESACRYLDKAEADGLMQDCVVRPQHAAARYRAAIARAKVKT